jgi:phage terminase large subunit-like protein
MLSRTSWSTAVPDWEERIVARRSLVPLLPIDEGRAEKALRCFGRLRLVDVPGQPRMSEACEPWVFDLVRAVFGACDTELNRQLVREFFVLVSKKNGKSSIAAGIMLTALILGERAMGEYLILAPTKDVADNSFVPAYAMVKADKGLFARYKPSDTTREIVDRLTGSVLAVKSADADVLGGQKATAVFVDELWLFGKKAQAENILSEATGSLVSRPEGFVIYASTQSDDPPAGVFRKKLQYYRDVRDGKVSDRTSLPLIYEYPLEMLKAQAWRDPSTWYIPNPSLGRSVDPEWLDSKLKEKEIEGPDSLKLYVAKHFNVEIGVGYRSDRWAGAEFWEAAEDPALTIEEILIRSDVVVVGIDGGGLDDLFGVCVLGRCRETADWLAWTHSWCHRSVLERRKSIASRLLAAQDDGELTICEHAAEDIEEIVELISDIDRKKLLACVAVDPAGLGEFIEALRAVKITQEGDQVIGAPQGYAMMNAIKTAERKVENGTLKHAPNKLMDWCVGNVKIEPTATAIRATKQNAGDAKIDPWMALMDAVTVMVRSPEPKRVPEYQMLFV